MTKWSLTTTVAATVIALAVSARADATTVAAKHTRNQNETQYRFDDDRLQSGVIDPNTPQITVLKQARRLRLHRPRVQFVTEMLKSVEAL